MALRNTRNFCNHKKWEVYSVDPQNNWGILQKAKLLKFKQMERTVSRR